LCFDGCHCDRERLHRLLELSTGFIECLLLARLTALFQSLSRPLAAAFDQALLPRLLFELLGFGLRRRQELLRLLLRAQQQHLRVPLDVRHRERDEGRRRRVG